MAKLRILVSNDDGIYAEGLNELVRTLSKIAYVDVVAPDHDKSGASHSLSLKNPLRPCVLKKGFAYLEGGTPTDCVHLAITGYLNYKPDLVVSGINAGANLGDDVIYSGTVAAAMEARILGIPAIAISLVNPRDYNYTTAAVVARQIVEKLQHKPLPAATILNVNVPDIPLKEVRGFEIARLGTRHFADPTFKSQDAHGREIYWIGPPGPSQDAGPGTDFHAVKSGYVSMTPIQVDLTNYAAFESLSKWTMGLTVE